MAYESELLDFYSAAALEAGRAVKRVAALARSDLETGVLIFLLPCGEKKTSGNN